MILLAMGLNIIIKRNTVRSVERAVPVPVPLLSHAPFVVIHRRLGLCSTCHGLANKEKTKSLASSVYSSFIIHRQLCNTPQPIQQRNNEMSCLFRSKLVMERFKN